jgi:hypothetical protein
VASRLHSELALGDRKENIFPQPLGRVAVKADPNAEDEADCQAQFGESPRRPVQQTQGVYEACEVRRSRSLDVRIGGERPGAKPCASGRQAVRFLPCCGVAALRCRRPQGDGATSARGTLMSAAAAEQGRIPCGSSCSPWRCSSVLRPSGSSLPRLSSQAPTPAKAATAHLRLLPSIGPGPPLAEFWEVRVPFRLGRDRPPNIDASRAHPVRRGPRPHLPRAPPSGRRRFRHGAPVVGNQSVTAARVTSSTGGVMMRPTFTR